MNVLLGCNVYIVYSQKLYNNTRHELLSTTDRYSSQESRTTGEISPDLNQSTQAPELLSITDRYSSEESTTTDGISPDLDQSTISPSSGFPM